MCNNFKHVQIKVKVSDILVMEKHLSKKLFLGHLMGLTFKIYPHKLWFFSVIKIMTYFENVILKEHNSNWW